MLKPSEDLQALNFKFLKIEDFQFLCFDLARELMSYGEPIPDYSEKDQGLLESALANPQQMFDGKLLYPSLQKQAAVLFYSLIKNHPFKNGNKRIAVMGLLTHLGLNSMWVDITPLDLYQLACRVSESKPSDKAEMLALIKMEIENHLIYFPQDQ